MKRQGVHVKGLGWLVSSSSSSSKGKKPKKKRPKRATKATARARREKSVRKVARSAKKRATKKTTKRERTPAAVHSWRGLYSGGPCGTERKKRRAAAREENTARTARARKHTRELVAGAEQACKVERKRKLTKPKRKELYTSGVCGAGRRRARKEAREEREQAFALNRLTREAADRPCREARAATVQDIQERRRARRARHERRVERMEPTSRKRVGRGLERYRERIDEQAGNLERHPSWGPASAQLFRKRAAHYFSEAKRRGKIAPYEVFMEEHQADPTRLRAFQIEEAARLPPEQTEDEWRAEQEREGRRAMKKTTPAPVVFDADGLPDWGLPEPKPKRLRKATPATSSSSTRRTTPATSSSSTRRTTPATSSSSTRRTTPAREPAPLDVPIDSDYRAPGIPWEQNAEVTSAVDRWARTYLLVGKMLDAIEKADLRELGGTFDDARWKVERQLEQLEQLEHDERIRRPVRLNWTKSRHELARELDAAVKKGIRFWHEQADADARARAS